MAQFFQQRFGLLQVRRVKAFREPVVDLGQHLVSFFPFPLALPQPRQAHRCSQLQGLRLLPVRNFAGFEKARFGFALGIGGRGSVFSDF